MTTDSNLRFIIKKITELRSAIMYSMCNSLVRLPNDIVTFVKVDEEGQLWFLSHLPSQSLKECEQFFPARLHFFRKGYDFFVEVSGKATIVSSVSSSVFSEADNISSKQSVLIKMTMSNIEYREPHTKNSKTKLELLAGKSYQWMLRNFALHSPGSAYGKLNQPH